MNEKLKIKDYVTVVFSIVLLVIFDQFTKVWAISHLKDSRPILLSEGVFQFQYLENRGAAFGIFQDQRILFIVLTVLILGIVGYFFTRVPRTKRYLPLLICMVSICAGAVGNFIDRLFRGFVVDFLYFSMIDFPIFNVADVYITVAFVAIIALVFLYYSDEELQIITEDKKKHDKEIHEEKD